jgi:hypothetical protein
LCPSEYQIQSKHDAENGTTEVLLNYSTRGDEEMKFKDFIISHH